ncbi:MAG: DUF4340 domain-containing protein [Deltaproteobacteria bacterium]|nr:MAG: DUF4340 domain-containing protein [Deltaproteobacteria bacterium]
MRQIAVLSGLLAVALGASYITWTAEEVSEADAEKIVLLQADEASLVKLVWKTDSVDAVVQRKSDTQGDYLWVDVSSQVEKVVEPEPATDTPEGETPEEGPALEGAEDEPEAEPEVVVETQRGAFKGNKSADSVWERFAPLYAIRELDLGGADPSVFGFDKPYGTLEVHRKSGPVTLVVGAETYGARDRYVKLDGRVYLVDDKVFGPLDKPESGLIDRLLQPNLEREMTTVTVAADGREITLVQENKDDAAAAYWAPKGGEELGTAATLVGNLTRLRVSFYPVEEIAGLTPKYTVRIAGDNGTHTIAVSEAADGNWYAQSDYNRALVQVVSDPAKSAFADINALLEEVPE